MNEHMKTLLQDLKQSYEHYEEVLNHFEADSCVAAAVQRFENAVQNLLDFCEREKLL